MKELTRPAKAAKCIKNDLKKLYPKTKFSVASKIYSGGSSVNVRWEGGPTRKEVERHVRKYEYGTFDPMTDCYDYNNVSQELPQVQYVCCYRDDA